MTTPILFQYMVDGIHISIWSVQLFCQIEFRLVIRSYWIYLWHYSVLWTCWTLNIHQNIQRARETMIDLLTQSSTNSIRTMGNFAQNWIGFEIQLKLDEDVQITKFIIFSSFQFPGIWNKTICNSIVRIEIFVFEKWIHCYRSECGAYLKCLYICHSNTRAFLCSDIPYRCDYLP